MSKPHSFSPAIPVSIVLLALSCSDGMAATTCGINTSDPNCTTPGATQCQGSPGYNICPSKGFSVLVRRSGMLSTYCAESNCTIAPAPASCMFNNQPVTSGGSVTAYQYATVPYGQSCQSETRICTNGSLSGSYTNPSCSVNAPVNCSFNGQTVADGSSVTAYQSDNVPHGQTCRSETRACTAGSLSGSYAYSACTVAFSFDHGVF